MNEHTNKKVICVKDIPSNLIEEAIFILKSDDEIANKKTKESRKQIILRETEDFVKKYTDEFSRLKNDEKDVIEYKKDLKLKIILCGVLVVVTCYLVSLFI